MENGFDRDGFMDYLEHTFNGFEYPIARGLVDNLIDYGLEHERISKDQMCYWLCNMIPEVEFGEVAMFIDDRSLTSCGLEEKRKALEAKC